MSRVEIRPIQLPRDTVRFVKTWWPIYEGDPHWVPPLIFERKAFFDPKKNPYHKYADIQCFIAYRDGRPVGTISAHVDRPYQEMEPGVGFFGFFEFIDDPEVAGSLMEAACDWLREKGMKEARGPLNFNTNQEFGCLVDGFDTDPCIANPHNREYYPGVYDTIGMVKSTDWYAYWMDNGAVPPRIAAIADRFMSRHPEITVRRADMRRYSKELEITHEIYEDAWAENWGHTHMSREEFEFVANGVKQLIDPNLFWFAFVDDEPAAMALTLPDYNQVVKKMNGRLLPFGWWHFLTGRKRIDQIRVWILGVKLKFQHLPLGAPLYAKTWEEGSKLPIRGAEASLVLEDNHRMRGALEKLGGRIYKTYRIYSRRLVDEATAEVPLDEIEDADTEAVEVVARELPESESGPSTGAEEDPGKTE
jgi:hypothetical protein